MTYDNIQGNEKHGSTLSLEDTLLEKVQEGSNWPPPAFLGIKIFLNYKKVSNDFMIYWNNLLKILYLKDYKWLLAQNQQERNDFFG